MKSLAIFFLILILSSCYVIYDKQKKTNINKHLVDSKKNNESLRPLCKYREQKGIAEFLGDENSENGEKYHQFIFYPGDEKFYINNLKQRELTKLVVGKEYHALKRSLISGHKNCQKIDIRLKPSLIQ